MTATTAQNERRLLGGAVKRIRTLSGLKQDTLAQAIGKHPAYVSNVENGKKQPSVATMCAIANYLGVDLDDISYTTVVYTIAGAA